MFAVRGMAVCFSVFFIFYGVLSLAVCLLWRTIWLYGQQCSASAAPICFLLLRIVPFVVATGSDPCLGGAVVPAAGTSRG